MQPADSPPAATAALPDSALGPRAVFRLGRTALHVLYGAATLALVYPWVNRPKRLWLKRRWSRQLLGCLGVQLKANADLAVPGALLVANHISWLDIFVINAVQPAAFVCKDDVRDWPLIGWMCAKTDTVFIQRGSRRDAHRTAQDLTARLKSAHCVAVFPEGTTSDGHSLLPFHGAMLQPAVDLGSDVQPVALRYHHGDGAAAAAAGYVGETTLWQSLKAVASATGLLAEARFLPPRGAGVGADVDRRHLSRHLHHDISRALSLFALTSPAPLAAHTVSGSFCDLPAVPPSRHRPTDSLNPAPADSAPA